MHNKLDMFHRIEQKVNTLKTLVNKFNETPDQIKISDEHFMGVLEDYLKMIDMDLQNVKERLSGKKNTIEKIEKECKVDPEMLRQAGEFLSQLPIEDDRVEPQPPGWSVVTREDILGVPIDVLHNNDLIGGSVVGHARQHPIPTPIANEGS